MKLIMGHDWEGQNAAIMKRVFPMIVKELGLTDVAEDVRIELDPHPSAGQEAATDGMARHPMLIRFGAVSLATHVSTLCHEMVHVRDVVRGNLHFTDNGGVVYHGKSYPSMVIQLAAGIGDGKYSMRHLPWEHEAYTLGPQIAAKIIRQLSQADIDFLIDGSPTFGMGMARAAA